MRCVCAGASCNVACDAESKASEALYATYDRANSSGICLRQYAEHFKRNLVDGLVLLSLTDKDLESELGIQLPVPPSPPSNAALVLALSL